MELVRLLKTDHPFFAFQVVDDRNDEDGSQDTFSSIEGRASSYIEALRKIQPEGPYWLGGWSFGGYVAYEMARQLTLQQQEIKILLLLDITTKIGRDAETADDVSIALRLANELKDLAQQPQIVLPEGEHLCAKQKMQYILDELIRSKLLDTQTDMKRLQDYLRGFRKRRHSLQVYEPLPYSGNITLIRTNDVIGAEVDSPTDTTRGWAELSPKPVQVHYVPGRHNNMVFMPHVTKLAETVRECLQNVEF
jgi:thioesterase domain-containing protein